ncbi:hypothetical protein VPH35_100571 [Triticum aestivum]
MATGGAPEPEEETIVLPDWMVLDHRGRTHCHNGLDAARVAVNKDKTAAPLDMDGGLSCYVSFTLAAPQKGNSYLNLHLPEERPFTPDTPPAYAHVRATDKDLVLFDITNPSRPCYWDPRQICSSTRPAVLPPLCSLSLWILRLAEDRYIVADLNVYPKRKGNGMRAELCIFNSETGKWKIIRKIGPRQWRTVPRTLIDYFSGVLLCDFSTSTPDSSALRFVPFPGENNFSDECLELRGRKRQGRQQQQQTPQKITTWTLNSEFKWKLHHVIDLDSFWAQAGYRDLHIDQRLPQFPIISVDDPGVLCCLLTEEEFLRGNGWMIMIGKHARLRSCESVGVEAYGNGVPQLSTVFSKYLERPTASQKAKKKRKRKATDN